MTRVALGLTYNGTPWSGWQRQTHQLTIQNEVEIAIKRFLVLKTGVIAAGRTDSGVHAVNQVIHLDTDAVRTPESWVRGVNTYLPPSIAVQWAQPVPHDFHARFSALTRTYVYIVRSARVRSPLTDTRVGWVFRPLDLTRMQKAATRLVGQHDFSCFRSSECQAASPIRTMQTIRIERHGDFFYFVFSANAFLHHMVRNIMGALIYIGQGRHPAEWIDFLLRQKDRTLSAPTFSPAGLYLVDVTYPEHYHLPSQPWRERLSSHVGLGFELG